VRVLDLVLDGREEGQGLTEYALILVFIALVAIVALTFLGQQLQSTLSNIGNSVALP
jgi:Flp pilus assembly pilin Flp